MKRIWMIVLLLSLGLNLGLGLGLLRGDRSGSAPDVPERARHWRPREGAPTEVAERMARRRLERMARELDLDRSQLDRLRQLHRERSTQIVENRRRQFELREGLQELMISPDATWGQIQEVMRAQASLQATLDSMIVRIMFDEREILSDEQRARYQDFAFPWSADPDGRRGRAPHQRSGRRHQP